MAYRVNAQLTDGFLNGWLSDVVAAPKAGFFHAIERISIAWTSVFGGSSSSMARRDNSGIAVNPCWNRRPARWRRIC
jgi:hypothetical protein